MIWPALALAAVAGVALYEWWKSPPAQMRVPNLVNQVRASTVPNMALYSTAAQQRAAACGYTSQDWLDAEKWSGAVLSPAIPLLARLKLMRSAQPPATWPASALRVWCTFVDTSPPNNPAGPTVRWSHWGN